MYTTPEIEEEKEIDNMDDCVDNLYHDSDFPIFEPPVGELNSNFF